MVVVMMRQFCFTGFILGAFACAFAMLISVLSCNVLGAIGFFILMRITFGIAAAIGEY
jgi:hypothetical protein